MHLHGQPFQVQVAGGGGPVKDTVNIAPMDQVTVDFVADNPGTWMLHCHNIYHAETGMHTLINYIE
jgi:FtsP/CotA-like multicopper oxidase with cupredoxin domain